MVEIRTDRQIQRMKDYERVLLLFKKTAGMYPDAKRFSICRAVARMTQVEGLNMGNGFTEQSVLNIVKKSNH